MKALKIEIKVALFVILAMCAIGYMFFFLSPDFFLGGKVKPYYTLVNNASGIVPKTHVKTNGVTVGKVDRVVLEGKKTKILFDVDDDVRIPEGSKIVIKEKGLLGDVFLEILRSDEEEDREDIPENGFIPPDDNHFSLSSLISVAGSMGADLKKITSSLAQVLAAEEGISQMKGTLANIKESTDHLKDILKDNKNDLREMIVHLKNVSRDLDGSHFSKMLENLRIASQDLREITQSGRDILAGDNKEKIQNIISSLDETLAHTKIAAENIKTVTQKIDRGEGTIGKLIHDEKMITEIQGAVEDVRSILRPATKLQVTVDYKGEMLADASARNHMNLIFQTRPETFYLLGFSDAESAVEDEILESLSTERDRASPDQSTPMTKTRKRTTKKDGIRFNLQYGKKWSPFQVRFGLFESRGGVGLDWDLLPKRLRLTLDVFDWDSKSYVRKHAHIKTYLSLLFFNHFSLLGGVHDWTALDPKTGKIYRTPRWFLGGGINFQDDDLKALFGTAALFN
jgi:phospholipid/cholesterol/gamma-HCH transport system substrate-binding protein